nr:hypothetical protein [Tanacetum cinerariifolium]
TRLPQRRFPDDKSPGKPIPSDMSPRKPPECRWGKLLIINIFNVFCVMKFDGGVKSVFGIVKIGVKILVFGRNFGCSGGFLVWGAGDGGFRMDVVGNMLLVEPALVEDDGVDGVEGCDVKGEE